MASYANGTCFGVDCLGAFPMVRKSVLTSIGACDQFLQMIKSVVQAEETYGRSLAKISGTSIETFPGTLQDCLSQLKADLNHKSTQHFHLAENLLKEVHDPILELRSQLECKEKEIAGQYLRMQQEIKHLEESYRKRFLTFEKLYRDAYLAVDKWRKGDNCLPEETNTFISSLTTSLPPSISSFTKSAKSKEILQWVVSSASSGSVSTSVAPPSCPDPQELLKQVSSKIKKAEKQRLLVRRSWIEYVITSQRYSLKAQILITKQQAMLESFVVVLQDHMRKMIVFESSSLANQQYDLNMLFKAMERIDVRGDLLGVIHLQKDSIIEDRSLWSSQIFFGGNLVHISSLPRPPTNHELTLELSEQPAYTSDEIASNISKLRLLQRKPLPELSIFGESFEGLGVYDGNIEEKKQVKTDETTLEQSSDDDEWYECAEDALSQLVDLQSSLRQHWLNVISEFNHEGKSSHSEISTSPPKDLEGEKAAECDEENLLMFDLHGAETPSPSNIMNPSISLNISDDIMASWGLLDVVQTENPTPEIVPLPQLDNPTAGSTSLISSDDLEILRGSLV